MQVALYRIAQEALSNVIKHAGATRASVRLCCEPTSLREDGVRQTEKVALRVEDDGCGFELAEVPVDSLGLTIMRERAAAIGADIEIQSQVGCGAQVHVMWPYVVQ